MPADAPPSAPAIRPQRRASPAADLPSATGGTRAFGRVFSLARDAVASALLRTGLTPNAISVIGFVATLAAAYCLLHGASQQVPYFYAGRGPVGWWPLWAGLFLIVAGACDLLDGAVARLGNLRTGFGAILDSTLDRFSDMAIFLGCLLHFGLVDNLTSQVLAATALCNAALISYVKARAEGIVEDCSVGWWLRGERCAFLLFGCLSGHVVAALWQLAILPHFTVWRRVMYSYAAVRALERGLPLPPRGPWPGRLGRLQLWRYPRGSLAYDIVSGVNFLFVVGLPWLWPALLGVGAGVDRLRAWLAGP